MSKVKLASNFRGLGTLRVLAKTRVSYLSQNARFFSYLSRDARQTTNPEIYLERHNGTGEFFQVHLHKFRHAKFDDFCKEHRIPEENLYRYTQH